MELNEKLSQLRKKKGLTQLELAETLNVSRQAVSRWEVGTAIPTLDNLVILSRLYNVPLDDLIQGEAPAATAETPPDTSAPPPSKAGGHRAVLVLTLFAALILGVGILIGINLPRRAKLSEIGPNDRVIINGPQARLERTPTDIEDELEWLETTVKDLLEEEKPPS